MNILTRRRGIGPQISAKDRFLNAVCGFSALAAFALSFSLFQPDGRPYVFSGCLVVYAASLVFADRKRDIVLASASFILLRLVWSAITSGLQVMH